MSPDILRSVYFSYFHSAMSYGVIFWGNAYFNDNIFKIQKRVIRIIANKGKRDSCRNLYNQLQILTLSSQYIYIHCFVIKHRDMFMFNSEIHDRNNRFNHDLHLPNTNLALTQRGVFYSGSIIYNYLPSYIKCLSKDFKQFKNKLKVFLLEHSYYSLEEFYQATSVLP